jgi:hypothetical protein
MRSESEDHLIPRRGDKGDDFWRRFSMVAKEETSSERERYVQKILLFKNPLFNGGLVALG